MNTPSAASQIAKPIQPIHINQTIALGGSVSIRTGAVSTPMPTK